MSEQHEHQLLHHIANLVAGGFEKVERKLQDIMSAISDFQTAVQASFDSVNTNLDAVSADLDVISTDIAALNALILQLQNSPGTITPADQASLDAIQALGVALAAKAGAVKAKTDAAVPVVPPVPPVAAK